MKPYEGINAYVFVRDAHREDLDRLRKLRSVKGRGVRAVAFLVGPDDAVVAVGAASLGQLQRVVMRDIRGGASPQTDVVTVLFSILAKIPMSPNLPPTVAFVRIRAAQGRVRDVLESVSELPGFIGAAAVAGSFDILLEIGGRTVGDVSKVLLDDLQRVGGITSSVTSFATEVVHAR